MSVTAEQCRSQIVADTQRLMGIGLLWGRMSAFEKSLTKAGLAMAQENGAAAQAYYAAMADKINSGMMRNSLVAEPPRWSLWKRVLLTPLAFVVGFCLMLAGALDD